VIDRFFRQVASRADNATAQHRHPTTGSPQAGSAMHPPRLQTRRHSVKSMLNLALLSGAARIIGPLERTVNPHSPRLVMELENGTRAKTLKGHKPRPDCFP